MSDTPLAALWRRAVEIAIAYRSELAGQPPHPRLTGAPLQAGFDSPLPEHGSDPREVLEALARAATPGLTASSGPRFFGWVIGASDPAGVAADILTSAWGQNAGAAGCSPAAAMAEQVVARWLVELLHLPPESSVGFVTGATMANFVCLAAARNGVLARAGWDVEAQGLQGGPRVRVILGADAHTTVFASLRYLGLGSSPVRIPTDPDGRMDAAALERELARGAGPATDPTIVIAQAGQICTGAFDPFEPIAAACRRHGAWMHVDGAFGLWALAVPALAGQARGCALADSWSTDGHKWLQLPYDSGFAIVRDAAAHQRAMSITASYLPQVQEYDPGQFVPELSRRARGFAAWMQIRTLGREGIVAMVERHCGMARRLAGLLAGQPGVRVVAPVHLNQVIVAFGEGSAAQRDACTRAVVARLRERNEVLAGGAQWHGEWVLRLSIIASPLQEAAIDRLAGAILAAWHDVRRAGGVADVDG